jgi:penicillin-binding protein 2
MRRTIPLVTENNQSFTFTRRAMVVGGFQLGVSALMAGRLAYLSLSDTEKYQLASEENRFQLVLVPPRRGWIVDRYGKPIAVNRSDYRIDLIPDQIKNPEQIIHQLAQLLDLPQEEVERIRDELKVAAGYQPVAVAENIPYEKYAAVTVRLPEMPGVAPLRGFSRFYPDGAAVGHLIGYVGTANKEEYEAEGKNRLLVTPGFKIGKEGLEKTMEPRLRGVPGAKRLEVTAGGRLVRELSTLSDKSGGSLPLTIDADLQEYAARRMGNESGSCVVMDCWTGDILCMASMPAYDPNNFSDGISKMEWGMLSEDERRPLLNKTLNALYPPGSTLKPMAAMALQQAGVDPEDTVYCGGGFQLGNRFFRCLGRHGTVNMHRAIAKSCNTYFYSMGRKIGIDRLAAVARSLGLGAKFDLPVVSQSYGTYPDTAWKKRRFEKSPRSIERPDWTESDTLNAAIGQGFVILNPLQLAVMSARIASGRDVQPQLLLQKRPQAPPLPYAPAHFDVVRKAMWEVVNGDGTAGRSKLPLEGVSMGGKTGTAQVRRITGGQRGQGGDWKYRDHGLFVFFAPTENPRYAGSVVIDHGMGGSRAAAPVAKDVLTFLFDRPKAMKALIDLEQSWGGTIADRMAQKSRAYYASKGKAMPETVGADGNIPGGADGREPQAAAASPGAGQAAPPAANTL